MTEHERLTKVEAALRDFFHREGWSLDSSTACQTVHDAIGRELFETDIDLAALAKHLVREGIVK
jgi:hypothetical protein